MPQLYPLRFRPLFKTMLWGGRRLPDLLRQPAVSGTVGEAWVLSDVDGNLSEVSNGRLAGQSLRQVIAADPAAVFGEHVPPDGRFPLLLKFIDARADLSVQVHPDDAHARHFHGDGFRGKTEAWVVLVADTHARLYAGFRPGVTPERFADAVDDGTAADHLHRFPPVPGDCLFLEAGTVHAIGGGTLLFEVQQTSDLTYRLYDWDRVDPATGERRRLDKERGLACAAFDRGACDPVLPEFDGFRERLVSCPHFTLHRTTTERPGAVGEPGRCSAVVCVAGTGRIGSERVGVGDAVLLPASVGTVAAVPDGEWTLLECGLGE